jgi:S1-C subfamily serine protease
VNLRGELVGINAQIVSPSGGNIGLGFAIPSSMAKSVADQLADGGVVHRAKLGVVIQPLTPELAAGLGAAHARGAVVSQVEAGSAGERAGLRAGDVITEIDGRPVTEANALRNQVAAMRPGTSVGLAVLRDGGPLSLTARLGEREARRASAKATAGAEHGESRYGMAVAPITPDVAEQMGLDPSARGLVVTAVDPDGPAAEAGVRPGDVVKSVNGRGVTTAPALTDALAARTDKPALILVTRNGADLFLALSKAAS